MDEKLYVFSRIFLRKIRYFDLIDYCIDLILTFFIGLSVLFEHAKIDIDHLNMISYHDLRIRKISEFFMNVISEIKTVSNILKPDAMTFAIIEH